MNTQALSKSVIAEDGAVIGLEGKLPKNFEQLSAKRQKQIVMDALRDEIIQITRLAEEQQIMREKIKRQNALIKNSKEFRTLTNMKKQLKSDSKLEYDLISEFSGMKKIALQLGLIGKDDLRKIKMITSGEED